MSSNGYNPQQQALIDAPIASPVIGVAGAGTGKTTTILARTKRILAEYQTGNILLITFTRAAANDLKKRLEAELEAFQAPSKQIDLPQEFSAYFLATDPYWKSVDDFGQDIAAITPRWGFPYMDHPELGVLVDVANFARKVVFDYDGNVPAYPTITITADAPVTNPKIVNGTAFVRLIDELDAGDIVNITTAPQRIRITKNGVNVLNKVDRVSNFAGLALQPGTNVVSFAADYGDNNLHVVLRYNKQYLGV